MKEEEDYKLLPGSKDLWIVPKHLLPKGSSYKVVHGHPKKKPENTVYHQKILTFLEGSPSKKSRNHGL